MPSPAPADDSPPVDTDRLPGHIAIIMDGNGRWAARQDLPRIEGHRNGVSSVRRVTEEAARLGLSQITLYCLSSENWKRPQTELDFLMHLLEQYVIEERSNLIEQNVRLTTIGRRDGLSDSVIAELDKSIEMTSQCSGLTLCLAINYGSRGEITDAARQLAQDCVDGKLSPADIDEQSLADRLYTASMSDPDLLIRTAGEMRVSNYLLWQISYAELWVTDKCWPEFTEADLGDAIADYASRRRTFGGLNDPITGSSTQASK